MVSRRGSNPSAKGPIVLAFLVFSAMLVGPVVSVLGQEAEDLGREVVNNLTGKDLTLSRSADAAEDGVGDGTDFAGNPATLPEGADVASADWHEVAATVDPAALAAFCANGLEALGVHVESICPEDLAAIETAARFIYVQARTSGTFDPATVAQFVFLWAEQGLATYRGAEADPNYDETDSIDAYRPAPNADLVMGRTQFRDGSFLFEAAFTGAIAFFGPGFIAFLIPQESFLAQCLNPAIVLIAGNAIDKLFLPSTPTGVLEEAPAPAPPTTTTTTPTVDAGPATPANETTTTEQQRSQAGSGSTEPTATGSGSDGGGIPPVVIVVLLVALGGIGFYLFTKRSKGCEEELAQLNRAKARLATSEQGVADARARVVTAEAGVAAAGENDARRARAQPDLTAAKNELADAEAVAGRHRESVAEWQHLYNVCMGFEESAAPSAGGLSPLPPPSEPDGDDPRDTPAPVSISCEELLALYDQAESEYEEVVNARGEAISAEGAALRAQTAATNDIERAEADDALEAAQAEIETAEAADRAAWDTRQQAWEAYLRCQEERRTQARGQAGAQDSAQGGDSTALATTVSAPTEAPLGCKDGDIWWQRDVTVSDLWVEPVGTMEVWMDRTTERFEQWLEGHGEVRDDSPSLLWWAVSLPAAIGLEVADAVRDDVSATLSLDDVEDLRNQASSLPLLRTERLKHWVTVKITVPLQEVARYCERKWICQDGGWIRTDQTRLGDKEVVGTVAAESSTYECETAQHVAQAFENELKKSDMAVKQAAQKETALRSKCSGGLHAGHV